LYLKLKSSESVFFFYKQCICTQGNYGQLGVIRVISFHIRCVVMVGLPYPNIYSPELKEKMTYLDATLGVRFSLCVDYLCQNRRAIALSRRWNLL